VRPQHDAPPEPAVQARLPVPPSRTFTSPMAGAGSRTDIIVEHCSACIAQTESGMQV
jgi:hypothetical protein